MPHEPWSLRGVRLEKGRPNEIRIWKSLLKSVSSQENSSGINFTRSHASFSWFWSQFHKVCFISNIYCYSKHQFLANTYHCRLVTHVANLLPAGWGNCYTCYLLWECMWPGILGWVKSHCTVLETGSTNDKFDTC